MNGITVDAADNFYAAGTLFDGDASGFAILLVAKFDATVTQQYGRGWQLVNINGARVADWVPSDIKVDSSGDAFMATTANDGTGGNMELFEVDPTGAVRLNRDGSAYGSADDEARALALDTTNNLAYLVGWTNSPDFGQVMGQTLTTTAAQPNYGGDPSDGVVIQDHYS
jgi:hypothetical protein